MSGDPNRGVPMPTVRPQGFGVYLHVEEGGEPLPQVGLGVTAQIPVGTRGQRPPHLRGVRLRGRGHPARFGVGMPVWELSWGCQGFGSDAAGDKLLVLSLASWGHPQCDGKTLVG